MRKHLIAIIVLALAGVANADPPGLTMEVDTPAPPDRVASDQALHFIVGGGTSLGRINAGDMTGEAGLHSELGFTRGRFTILAELDLAALEGSNTSQLGTFMRYGIDPRIAIIHRRSIVATVGGVPTESITHDIWIEPAVGLEVASQQAMMKTLNRSDVAFGVGVTRMHQYASHAFGGFVALRGIESYDSENHRDTSIVFNTGVFIGH
jgi:hypothetical protein